MLALRRPPTASAAHAAPTIADPPAAELPLQSRIWHLFCQGYSHTAIGEQLGLERHAVARHVRAVQAQLAREHADDLALTRQRAVEAAFTLHALCIDHLAVEHQREAALWRDYEQVFADLPADDSLSSAPQRRAAALFPLHNHAGTSASTLPPAPVKYYRAGRTRLLGIALAALRHAIRLSGLEADNGPGGFIVPHLPATPGLPDLSALLDLTPRPTPGPRSVPTAPTPAAPSSPRLPSIPAPAPSTVPPQPIHRPSTPLPRAEGPEVKSAPTASSADDTAIRVADPVQVVALQLAPDQAPSPLPAGRGAGGEDTPNSGTQWNIPIHPRPSPQRPTRLPNQAARPRKRPTHH